MVSLLLLRLGLCILGHPSHAGHRVRSSARLPLSISLFGPVRPCVPLKTTSSIGPISVGLALPKRKAGPFFAERCRHPGGGFCAVLRGFGAYFSSPWAYPQQTAFRVFRSPCLSLCQPALFLGKRSIPWLWRCAFCAVSVFDSGRSLWAVPLQPPGRPSSRWGLRPCAFCARSFRRLGVLCRFRICGFCASKRIPTSEFSLDLESRFADFRVLGPSRWLPVDGESVRTRFPPGSIAFWRLCAPVLCFCLCPPKFCASRFGKSRSMEKEFPSFFVWFFRVLRRVSAGTAPEAAIFPLCLCRSIVGFSRLSGCLLQALPSGLCPCASAHPGLAGRVPISGFPLDRSCSQPRSFARPAACGFFAVRRLLRIAA